MSKKQLVRTATGQRKIAPINMRREEHQFVIDGFLVDEVLSQLPPTIKILQARVRAFKSIASGKVVVPNALRKLGVTSMWTRGAGTGFNMTFDQTSKENIRQKVKEACLKADAVYQKAYFENIVISNGEGNVKFEYCTKEIKPDETDLRKKLKVLGATIGEGKVQSVISTLNAKKYKCVVREEPVKFVMCYKE